ncbi:hypothetical protein XENOCAPTIV_020268, partial [Xenoophorus captivus]
VMENEEGRKEYLVFPPSKNQCPASSQKGRKIPLKGNGRRIDYILYSDEGIQQDWKLVRLERDNSIDEKMMRSLLLIRNFTVLLQYVAILTMSCNTFFT